MFQIQNVNKTKEMEKTDSFHFDQNSIEEWQKIC